MSARSKIKKRYGESSPDHESKAGNYLRAVIHHVDSAAHAYEKGNCLETGTKIDDAWMAIGKALAHIESMDDGGAGSRARQMFVERRSDIEWIDSKFEKTCVRKKPTK